MGSTRLVRYILHQQPLDAPQRRSADQTVTDSPDRHGEGQFALIRAPGFKQMARGRDTAHPPVPIVLRFEPFDREGQPDTYWRPDAACRSGPNIAVAAINGTDGGSPARPGMGIGNQTPDCGRRRIKGLAEVKGR